MNKKLISTLVTMVLAFNMSTTVKAILPPTQYYADEFQVKEQYSKAYNMTMNVVDLGKRYGVKPFYKEGSSSFSNVVEAVANGDLQAEILSARSYINILPGRIQTLKNTLSSILDDYQHPIYESIVNATTAANTSLKPEITTLHETSNVTNSLFEMVAINTGIYYGQLLIQDVPQPFKSSYSSAFDQSKQKVLNFYISLVELLEKNKNEALKNYALRMFNFETDISTNGEDVINFINSLKVRVNNVVTTPAITEGEMIVAATANGFTKVTDLSSLPYGIDKYKDSTYFKEAFMKTEGSTQLYFIVCKDSINLYSSDNNLSGALELIKQIAPMEGDKIIALTKAKEDNGILTSNGLISTTEYNSNGNFSLLYFFTFK